LITALAIDPAARTDDRPGASGSASAALSQPPIASPSLPPASGSDRADLPPAASQTAATSRRLRMAVGAEGEALAGFAPGAGLGAGVFVDLTREQTGPLAFSMRATLLSTAADASFGGPVGAHLVWLLARFEVCPLRLRVEDYFDLSACAALDAGALRSEGEGLATTSADTRPWVAPGALGRVAWDLAGGSWIEASGGLSLALDRYSFHYQRGGSLEQVQVSEMPLVGGALALGAGYRFP
jgi:hypothetical protein